MEVTLRLVIMLAALLVVGGLIALIVYLAARGKGAPEAAGSPYGPAAQGQRSFFDGNTWQLIGWHILAGLLIAVTLGIGTPWAVCMLQRWEAKHTVLNGRRLRFTGKGIQLLGKYLLWCLLTVITLGIYGIWLGLNMKKWVVKHTVYADDPAPVESCFSGGAGGYLGIHLLAGLLTIFTLGIGAAWGEKKVLQWEARHTHIGGSPLEFNGTGGQLFGKYLLMLLLTPLTLGIYALFFPVSLLKWQYSHTDAVYQTPRIRTLARAHEPAAQQDYNRFHLAANDAEVAVLKSGVTGSESLDELQAKAADGNPYAKFQLFLRLPEEDPRSAEYLQAAADAGYGPAQYALALRTRDPRRMTAAAQAGSPEAAWWLKNHWETAGELQNAAYWFKIALEWQEPNALAAQSQYPVLLTGIALALSEQQAPRQKNSPALPIILGVIAGVLVLGGILACLLFGTRAKESLQPVSQVRSEITLDGDAVLYDETDVEMDAAGSIFPGNYWEPGDIRYTTLRLENKSDEQALAYSFSLLPASSSTHAKVRLLDHAVTVSEFEALCRDKEAFLTIESASLTGSVQPGQTGYITVIIWWDPEAPTAVRDDLNNIEIGIRCKTCPDGSQLPEPTQGTPTDPAALAGQWIGWDGSKQSTMTPAGTAQQAVTCEHWSIGADGTFTSYSMMYYCLDDGAMIESYNPVKHVGTWELADHTFTVHYEYVDYPAEEPNVPDVRTESYTVSMEGSILYIDGFDFCQLMLKDGTPEEIVAYLQGGSASSADALAGTWINAYRVDTAIFTEAMILREDGTLVRQIVTHEHPYYSGSQVQTGWYVAPTGHPCDHGSYTLDDASSVLSVTITHNDVGYNYPHAIALPRQIDYIDSGKLVLDGQHYYRDDHYSLEEICRLCGVDMSVPS